MTSKRSDALIAVFVLAIAAMLVVPLPTFLLDLLLAVNLSFSLLLLLVGLYMPNALGLLTFPTILLLSTLFRLGLNVASTRLILADGDAGRVIESFGTFLIRGELVVGLIIFIIIGVVNFVVIARGASRVSEVAARFALDALPGKQMAIDADVRAGLTTVEQAQSKRESLRRESQLYGAMDGAMKFVQGDVVAGLFITAVNIVGGIYMGITQGLGFGEAVTTYTTLTIGDGLVSQIPALLTAICAGIVVTRVAADEESTLGRDLSRQLFANPQLLLLAGALVFCLPLLTGLPWVPFLATSSFLLVLGLLKVQFPQAAEEYLVGGGDEVKGVTSGEPKKALPDRPQASGLTDASPVHIRLEAGVLFEEYQSNRKSYGEKWQEFSSDFNSFVGISFPSVKVIANERLKPNQYELEIKRSIVKRGEVFAGAYFIEMNPLCAQHFGLEVLKVQAHPLHGGNTFWAPLSASQQRILEQAGVRTLDFLGFLFLELGKALLFSPEDILSLSDVHRMTKDLEQVHPGLVGLLFQGQQPNVPRLAELMQNLIRDGVPIGDFKGILETFASYCARKGLSMGHAEDLDMQEVLSYFRIVRSRTLVGRWLQSDGSLKAITLSPALEESLEHAHIDLHSRAISLDPSEVESAADSLSLLLSPVKTRGVLPLVVLCRAEMRGRLSALLRLVGEGIGVLAFEELDPGLRVETVGEWGWG